MDSFMVVDVDNCVSVYLFVSLFSKTTIVRRNVSGDQHACYAFIIDCDSMAVFFSVNFFFYCFSSVVSSRNVVLFIQSV